MINESGKHVIENGEKWYLFDIPYTHNGVTVGVHLYARSIEEANAMLESLKATAQPPQQINAPPAKRGSKKHAART